MSELDIVLASYRDMFGVKTERANEIHRLACEEVARLRAAEHRVQRTCAKCGNSGKPITDIGGNQSCPECGASR